MIISEISCSETSNESPFAMKVHKCSALSTHSQPKSGQFWRLALFPRCLLLQTAFLLTGLAMSTKDISEDLKGTSNIKHLTIFFVLKKWDFHDHMSI